jgi:hypothetical protein
MGCARGASSRGPRPAPFLQEPRPHGWTVPVARDRFGGGENGFSSFVAPLQAQSDATYIEDNTALPAIVRDNIASFVGSNGLGTAWDGVTTPTPAEQALYSLLTAEVPPFVITSDTGDVQFGTPFEFVSAWGPFGPVPGSPNTYVIGTTNTDVYERTIDERLLTAVPEPSTWAMMLVGSASSRAAAGSLRRPPPELRAPKLDPQSGASLPPHCFGACQRAAAPRPQSALRGGSGVATFFLRMARTSPAKTLDDPIARSILHVYTVYNGASRQASSSG